MSSIEQIEKMDSEEINIITLEFINNHEFELNKIYKAIYGNQSYNNPIARKAFYEQAKVKIKEALLNYSRLGKTAPIESYIFGALSNLKTVLSKQESLSEYHSVAICPLCRNNNIRSYMSELDYNTLVCPECSKLAESSDLHNKFHKHSKAGYRCQECFEFIPKSMTNSHVSCPYDGCFYVVPIDMAEKMPHPYANVRMANKMTDDSYISSLNSGYTSPESDFMNMENAAFLFKKLKRAVDKHRNSVKKGSLETIKPQKLFILDAFDNLIDSHPNEMAMYLSKERSYPDSFIHTVFMNYVNVVELALPCEINNELVLSLLDPKLKLFRCKSVYTEKIIDGFVKNSTKETYIGGRNHKFYGPNFIGKLLDIKHNDISIMDHVTKFGFNGIHINGFEGETVEVEHLSLLPHYDLGPFVHIKNVRTAIIRLIERRHI